MTPQAKTPECIGEIRPSDLVVRLDCWVILCQGKLEPDVGVEVTVRQMVDDLPHRPTAGSGCCLYLNGRQPRDARSKSGRCRGDLFDPLAASFVRGLALEAELANWVRKSVIGGSFFSAVGNMASNVAAPAHVGQLAE